jgi:hypothetical protein
VLDVKGLARGITLDTEDGLSATRTVMVNWRGATGKRKVEAVARK